MYYGYIYKTTNNINNKIYIGQHKGTDFDNTYYGSGKYLHNAISKYGIENFNVSVVEFCETKDELNLRERFWIKHYNSQDATIGYNISSGGDGGDTFTNQPEQIKQQIRLKSGKSTKGKIGIFKDGCQKYVTPDSLHEYLSAGWVKGSLPVDKSTIEKLRVANSGRIYVTNGNENKKILPQDFDIWEARGFKRGFTSTDKMQEASKARSKQAQDKKSAELEEWKKTPHYCLTCGKLLTEYIGTGRYCSKSCSATHPHSQETKDYIRTLNLEGKCGMKGKRLTEEQRLNHSNAMRGKNIGKKWVTDGNRSLRVAPEEVDSYLQQGFRLGRTGNFKK